METKNQLGKQIQVLRKKSGLTQIEFSKRAGVGLRFVRDLEQGKPSVRLDKVNQVLALFGKKLGPVDKQRGTGGEETVR